MIIYCVRASERIVLTRAAANNSTQLNWTELNWMLNTTVVAQLNVCMAFECPALLLLLLLLLLLPSMLLGTAIGGVCMHNNNDYYYDDGDDDDGDDYDDITNGVNTISRAFCQFSIRLTSIWSAWCLFCVVGKIQIKNKQTKKELADFSLTLCALFFSQNFRQELVSHIALMYQLRHWMGKHSSFERSNGNAWWTFNLPHLYLYIYRDKPKRIDRRKAEDEDSDSDDNDDDKTPSIYLTLLYVSDGRLPNRPTNQPISLVPISFAIANRQCIFSSALLRWHYLLFSSCCSRCCCCSGRNNSLFFWMIEDNHKRKQKDTHALTQFDSFTRVQVISKLWFSHFISTLHHT